MYGLMAGLANAYTGIQAGIDRDRERQAREQELKIRDEEQAARRADREWQTGQRQRTLAEQQRADQLRTANAAIPTTRTVQREVGPGLSEDAAGNIYADPSQPPQTRTVTAANPRFAQLRQMADNERQFGDPARALELTALADKEMWGEASRRATALRGSSTSMTPMQIAEQARRIFNEDPFPLDITDVKEIQGGGVSFTLRNKDTGETTEWTAKDRNELLAGIEAYYSPATFEENRKLFEKARLERETELLKPQKLGPGDKLFSGQRKIAENTNPTPAELRYGSGEIIGEDANGNPIYAPARGAGSGSRAGRNTKPEEPFKPVDDAVKAIVDSSNFKDSATPEQAARVRTLARKFHSENQGADPTLVAEAALIAATRPERVQQVFDPNSGQIVSAVTMGGRNRFIVEKHGAPGSLSGVDAKAAEAIATQQLQALRPDQAQLYLGAARSANQLDATLQNIEQVQRSPAGIQALQQVLGREPTAQEIDSAVRLAQQRTRAYASLFSSHLPKKMLEEPRRRERQGVIDRLPEEGLGNTAAEMINQFNQ